MNLTKSQLTILLKFTFVSGQRSGSAELGNRLGLKPAKRPQTFDEFMEEVLKILEPKLEPEPQK